MSWPGLHVWVAGEFTTAALLNLYIRDAELLLKTYMDDEGGLAIQRKTFAVSVGQANSVGGAWEVMTSYTVSLPANYLNVPGDAVLLWGLVVPASNANLKQMGYYFGTAGPVVVWQGAENLASHRLQFRLLFRRRTQTTGVIEGLTTQSSGNPTIAVSAWKLCYIAISGGDMDFALAKDLKVAFNCPAIADLRMTDYYVCGFRAKTGALV